MQMVNIEQEPAVLDRWSARFCWPWGKRRSINRISEDPKFGLDSGRVGARGYVRQDGDRSRSEACQGGKASWRAENCQGPELDVLIAASKKAQKESQEFPLEAQIRAREGFVERVKKRIEQFDLERAAEVQRLEESQKRLAELRALQVVQPGPLPPPVDANAEVGRLQQMVLDLQRQLQGPVAPLVSPFRSRKREDYDPATEHVNRTPSHVTFSRVSQHTFQCRT